MDPSDKQDTEAGENHPLREKPASPKSTDTCIPIPTSCCQKLISSSKNRRLAIMSIICGISCFGIVALIYTIKAEGEAQRAESAKSEKFSKRARKWSIISIVVWVSVLVLTPILMALFSYLLTLID